MIIQFIINGIVMGAIYSLVALGYALVYNTTKIFHIAYSVLYMFAPYMMFTFYKTLQLPFLLSFLFSIILTMILSLLIEFIVYRPLDRKKSSLNVIMISSIGVMIIIINTIAIFYGNETKVINSDISDSVSFYNIIITYPQIYQFTLSVIIIAIFFLILKYSRFGIKTRSMRDDVVLCKIFGMDIYKTRTIIFAISAMFAAIAGVLIAYDVGMDPYVGMPMLLNAVVALIIGGIGRFEAPILGGFIIGLLQALTVWIFSSKWQDAITFLILIIFLLTRPQGILGERKRIV